MKSFMDTFYDYKINNYYVENTDDGGKILQIVLPGVKKEDIKIEIEPSVYGSTLKVIVPENKYCSDLAFTISSKLKEPAATLENGVLTLVFTPSEPKKNIITIS